MDEHNKKIEAFILRMDCGDYDSNPCGPSAKNIHHVSRVQILFVFIEVLQQQKLPMSHNALIRP